MKQNYFSFVVMVLMLIAAVCCSGQQRKCVKKDCQSVGGACNQINQVLKEYNYCLQGEAYCANQTRLPDLNFTDGVCKTFGALGDACDLSNPCGRGFWCKRKVCTDQYLSIGQPCNYNDYSCVEGAICVKNVCAAAFSLPVGGDCTYDSGLCAFGLFCDYDQFWDGNCQPTKSVGTACKTTSLVNECAGGLLCIDDKCTALGTVIEGGNCGAIPALCATGLVCGRDDKCMRPVPADEITHKVCNGDSECPMDSTCECNDGTGVKECWRKAISSNSLINAYTASLQCTLTHTKSDSCFDQSVAVKKSMLWEYSLNYYCSIYSTAAQLIPSLLLLPFLALLFISL